MADGFEKQRELPLPDELRRWNWGAFLLNWIWGVGNNTYIALLMFVPFFGILIMPFVLGAKGNEWAWRNGRWDSIQHFKRVQRGWAIWGLVALIGLGTMGGLGFAGVVYALTKTEPYRLGVAKLQGNKEAAALLGQPIVPGFPSGAITTSGETGRAFLEFSATGRKTSGHVTLRAAKENGAWSLTELQLHVGASADAVDLLKADQVFFSIQRRAGARS